MNCLDSVVSLAIMICLTEFNKYFAMKLNVFHMRLVFMVKPLLDSLHPMWQQVIGTWQMADLDVVED